MLKILAAVWNAIKPTLASKKTQLALFTTLANLLLYFGIELDVEVAMGLTSPLITAIVGHTAVDVQKAKAASAAALVLLVALGACGPSSRAAAGRVAGDVIDCMAPTARDAIATFAPAIANVVRNATAPDGKVDWAPVRDVGRSLKTPAAQCVMASVIAEALRPPTPRPDAPLSSPLQWDPVSLVSGWEDLRADWGGKKYQLAAGVL